MPQAIPSAVPFAKLSERSEKDQDASCHRCRVSYRWQGKPSPGEAQCPRCGDAIRPAGRGIRRAYKWLEEKPNQEPEAVKEKMQDVKPKKKAGLFGKKS